MGWKKGITAAIAVLFLTAACAGPFFTTKQENAGITHWKLSPDVECVKSVKTDKTLCYKVEVFDGKEKADVKVSVTRELNGSFTVSYSAELVKAFEGQKVRAEVEIAVVDMIGDVLPDMVDALVDAIMDAINPLP